MSNKTDIATYAHNCEHFERISIDAAKKLITERVFNRLVDQLQSNIHTYRELYDPVTHKISYLHLILDNGSTIVYVSDNDGIKET